MKTIYVIDDEIMITELLDACLSRIYKIIIFNDPSMALKEFTKDIYIPDCIISDITMPKLNGIELVLEIRLLRMDIPIILMTGKQLPIEISNFPMIASIIKPFSLLCLKKIVHESVYPNIPFIEVENIIGNL